MKKHFIPPIFLLLIAFAGCNKEAANKTSLIQSAQLSSVQSEQASTTFNVADNGDGTFTATLQPDSANGQDVLVNKIQGTSSAANGNNNYQPEIDISAWTINGSPVVIRSYLRFVDLAKISSSVHVLSATLYLYGLSSSNVIVPGNSTYPGSPYTSYGTNRCMIEPVRAIWDENTITWNNQPKAFDKNTVYIPKSTSQWNYDIALNVTQLTKHAVMYPETNYGVRISLANETYYRNMAFATSEVADPTKRPKLVVTYE